MVGHQIQTPMKKSKMRKGYKELKEITKRCIRCLSHFTIFPIQAHLVKVRRMNTEYIENKRSARHALIYYSGQIPYKRKSLSSCGAVSLNSGIRCDIVRERETYVLDGFFC